MKRYCEECGREVNTRVVNKYETYEICGENIEVEAQVLTCAECGEEFFYEEFDSTTLLNAYGIYRKKHKLLFPEEIKEIREKYGLSQRSFAKLLNWGDKTIYRYENGALQDKAHNSVLIFLRNPANMKSYLLNNEVILEEKKRLKIIENIDIIESNSMNNQSRKIVEDIFYSEPSINNGFKSFDYDKFCAMVDFFSKKFKGILKVKLIKMLNYSDMIYYKENGISISGTQYVHLPFGPVPKNYDILFGVMEAEEIMHIDVEIENGYEKHLVFSDCDISDNILSDREKAVLERIYDKFVDFGSVEISNYSHNEIGYMNTIKGEVISYAYAKDIQLN